MDKEFFMNTQLHQYDHPFTTQMPTWQTLSNAMEIQSSQSPECFLSPHKTTDHFESALSSMVSSPNASTSAISKENFVIRELIGKLGSICNSGDIPTGVTPPILPYIGGGSANNSCYSTPLSSPPKIGLPSMDQLVKESFPSLGNSVPISSNLPAMPGGPGFAERAARFSSFGSRSFNGRTSPFVVNNNNHNNNNNISGSNNNNGQDFTYRSNNSLAGGGKLQRVSSTPSLKAAAESTKNSPLGPGNANNERKQTGNSAQDQGENLNSKENSSVSGQSPPVENGSNRKRKAATKSKGKEAQSSQPTNTNKAAENEERSNAKRSKSEESEGKDDGEEKSEGNRTDDKKQSNSDEKQTEPLKDYIHVRARRGQATDSHSLAERVRREKISERMKLLQDLVPGCNKVTGKALMLDEIINYVQSLQRQVEFLSMKLSSVNPRLEFNVDNLFSKDHVIQPNGSVPHPMYPLDSLAPTLYGQPHQNNLTTGGPMAPCPMDPLNPNLNQNNALQLPQFDGFPNGVPQLTSLCQGDLQSIVQMGYGQKEDGFQSQPLSGTNQTSLMKIEF